MEENKQPEVIHTEIMFKITSEYEENTCAFLNNEEKNKNETDEKKIEEKININDNKFNNNLDGNLFDLKDNNKEKNKNETDEEKIEEKINIDDKKFNNILDGNLFDLKDNKKPIKPTKKIDLNNLEKKDSNLLLNINNNNGTVKFIFNFIINKEPKNQK